MLHAVSFAFIDSINLLLIGVIIGLGIILAPTAKYGRVVTILILGDWIGVLALCLAVLPILDAVRDTVEMIINSPWLGGALIAFGALTFVLTVRSHRKGTGEEEVGTTNPVLNRFTSALREPSWKTAGIGLLLGVVQSATSVPFYMGLAFLSAGGFPAAVRYASLPVYASIALSLPIVAAILVGLVRHYPNSVMGKLFEKARARTDLLASYAGHLVALLFVVLGISMVV